jgi:hypothetical protein
MCRNKMEINHVYDFSPLYLDFFLLKTIDLIAVFLQLIEYWFRSNRCFFRHRCPPVLYAPPPQHMRQPPAEPPTHLGV